jgi:WD40 repeat protein
MLLRLIALLFSFTSLVSAMNSVPPLTDLCLRTISNHELDSKELPQHYKQLIKKGLIRQNGSALWAAAAAEGALENHKTHPENAWRENLKELIAISANDNFIVIASFDNTVKVWDLETGRLIHSLEGHTNSITSIAIAIDDSYIVTGSRDATAKLWDTKTGKCLCTFSGHKNVVTSVAINSSQRQIVTGSLDGTAKVWDGYRGKLMYTLENYTLPIKSVFIMDHNTLIGTQSENSMKVWDIKTGQLIHIFEQMGLMSLSTSVHSEFIAAADSSGHTKIWNVKTGELTFDEFTCRLDPKEFSPPAVLSLGSVLSLERANCFLTASNEDGHLLVTSHFATGRAQVFNIKTGESICTLYDASIGVTSIAISPDTKFVVKSCCDNSIKVWDRETGEVIQTLSRDFPVELVKISNRGNFIIGSSFGLKEVKVWDTATGKLIHTFKDDSLKMLNLEAKSSNGSFIAARCKTNPNSVEVYDAKTTKIIHVLSQRAGEKHMNEVTVVAISPDNTFIVTGSKDQTAMLWDAKTGKLIFTHYPQRFGVHWAPLFSLAIDPSNTCITIGFGGLVYLWKITGFINPLLEEKVSPEDVLKIINTHRLDSSSKGYCAIQ